MSDNMNKIKNHPGFMPFGCKNVKGNTEETQSERDVKISEKETASDSGKGN